MGMEKIQSCLYSSCIYIKTKTNKYDDINDISFEDDFKINNDSIRKSTKSISVDQYCSYLSAREILIEKLLQFMLIYPKKYNKSDKDKNKSIKEYYSSILPYCLYCLIII